jgi:hypothetical protein
MSTRKKKAVGSEGTNLSWKKHVGKKFTTTCISSSTTGQIADNESAAFRDERHYFILWQ